MTINYITKDGHVYDQRLVQDAVTSDLETAGVKLLDDGQSFTLTTIETSGYKDHTRNKGFNSGTYENRKKVYTMTQDRDIEFYVDTMDAEETGQDLAVARISNTFITEQATPEVDAYRLSTLATKAITNGNSKEEALTVENVYSRLKAELLPVRKYGASNIIVYVSSETMDLLERSKEFTRNITNQNVGQTALESRITSLDGVVLKEVWDADRFWTAFDFTDGFKPTETAKEINFLIVVKPAQISVVKHRAIFLFAPGTHTQGDGYLYQNHLYHDTFLKEEQKEGVRVSIKADADPGI